jgi:hypothetical protein
LASDGLLGWWQRTSGLVTVSAVKEKPGGTESVIHTFAAGLPDPPGLRVKLLSNNTTALLF